MIQTGPAGFLSIGQESAQRIARRTATEGRTAGTLLVHGPRGAGKGAFVDDLLALAFCTADDRVDRPCNACRGCRDARARTHPDLVVGSPEAWRDARSVGESIVAVARRWLLDASGAPISAERRIVLVEHADRASEQIQNALLKALEEPSDRHTFILVADDPTQLLPTVRSRCHVLRLGPVPHDELVAHLMDMRRLPLDQATTLAHISNGLAGAALGYADRADLIEWRRRTQSRLLDQIAHGPADRFEAVRDLLDDTIPSDPIGPTPNGDDAESGRAAASIQRAAASQIVDAWIDLARDLLVAGAGRPNLAPSGELAPDVAGVAERLEGADLVAMLRLLERIGDGLRDNASPRLALETAMLAWPRVDR